MKQSSQKTTDLVNHKFFPFGELWPYVAGYATNWAIGHAAKASDNPTDRTTSYSNVNDNEVFDKLINLHSKPIFILLSVF